MPWIPNKLSNLQPKPVQTPNRRYVDIIALHSRSHYIPTPMVPNNVYGLLLIQMNVNVIFTYIVRKVIVDEGS